MARFAEGVGHALVALLLQVGLLHLFDVVPGGTRGQAVGVCLATLSMLVGGFLLGWRHRHPAGVTDETSRLAALKAAIAPWNPAPWREVAFTVLALAGLGALGSTGALDALLPGAGAAAGSASAAAFVADLAAGPVYVSFGAALGANHRPGTLRALGLGVLAYAGLFAGILMGARNLSYEPTVVAGLQAGGLLMTALVVGVGVAWARRRLAFVELMGIALAVAYGLYLLVAAGPPWLEAGGQGPLATAVLAMQGILSPLSMVPAEQILLGLALFPTVAFGALLTVGGSLGFLLNGGGRFDPGLDLETKVAFRYLRAHGRDGFVGTVTIIAVVGVCLGVMALIVVLSVMSGFENDLKMKILGAHAHIVVNKKGDDFTEYREVERQIRETEGVKSAVAFVLGDAMISTDVGLSGTLVKGVDVTDAPGVAELRAIVEQGDFDYLSNPGEIPGARPRITFPPPPVKTSSNGLARPYDPGQPAIRAPKETRRRRTLPGILIGRELSKTLRAYVGDTVKLVSPSSDEIGPLGPTPKLRRFRVAGVFYSGMYEYDAKFTYIDMKQAQRFFGLRRKATGVEVKLDDIDETGRLGEEIKRRVGGYPYRLQDWRTMNRELFSALLLEKLAMFIALGMIVMVASFLIVAVLVMIVLQRKKEIAILKSLGASDSSVMKIFVVQGTVLGVGGALLGGGLGVGICLLVAKFGVELDPRVFYIERLPVVMNWGEISAIAICAVLISYLATIYPAMTAALHPPVEGLRDD